MWRTWRDSGNFRERRQRWCRRERIRSRFGAVGQRGSIAVIDPLMVPLPVFVFKLSTESFFSCSSGREQPGPGPCPGGVWGGVLGAVRQRSAVGPGGSGDGRRAWLDNGEPFGRGTWFVTGAGGW
jgi:hypothetical protein